MVINQPGNVTDKIVLLGRRESCVYLLKGQNEYALLGGGMVTIAPDVLEQIESFKMDFTVQTRALLEASYAPTGNVEQSSAEITDLLMEKIPGKLLPKEIIDLVVGQMFNFIAKQAGNSPALR